MIKKESRQFNITTTAGKVYHFTTRDIVKGSGTLTRSCAGSTSLELGSVYAAELDISLFLDVDRYSLYDAVIDLNFVCRHSVKRVWNDLRPFTWGAMRTKRWNDRGDTETIPMGKFVVSEATRTLTILQLKAYCKEHGIHLNGPRLGKPAKDPAIRKQELHLEWLESGERGDIERRFGIGKRCYSLGRITAKL